MQYLLWIAAIINFLDAANAIKCYACESVYEPHCGENFEMENYFKYDCAFVAPPRYMGNDLMTTNATGCMKREYKENGIRKFSRSCYFGDVNDTDIGCRLDPTSVDIHESKCYVCANENFCNTAAINQFIAWQIIVILGITLAVPVIQLG